MDELNKNQKQFINVIEKIIMFDKISHSYLIEIDDYDINYNLVISFVKLMLCKEKIKKINELNCNRCNICNLVDNHNYPDLEIIEPDGNWIKKDQLLKLQNEYMNKSLLNNKRIYIIKNAERLNPSSANTILKFLEEPEDNIIAILLTNNRYKVLDTILSRCQILSLTDFSFDINICDETIELLNFIKERDALFINYNYIYNKILSDKNIAIERLLELENIYIGYLNLMSFNYKYDIDDKIINILKDENTNKLIQYISIIESEIQRLNYNVNYKLWLDNLFAEFVEVR